MNSHCPATAQSRHRRLDGICTGNRLGHLVRNYQRQLRSQLTKNCGDAAIGLGLNHQLATQHGNAVMELLQLDVAPSSLIRFIRQGRKLRAWGQPVRASELLQDHRGSRLAIAHGRFDAPTQKHRSTSATELRRINAHLTEHLRRAHRASHELQTTTAGSVYQRSGVASASAKQR